MALNIEAQSLDRDISRERQRRALSETARYVDENLALAPVFGDKFKLLAKALESVELKGLYCEFGVYTGGTVNFIASQVPAQIIHGFDSFEGLPETWRSGFGKGTFAVDGLPKVAGNVRLHKGWFHESLPGFLREHRESAAFLHMDADLYSSTKTVFDLMADRIVPGTVIVFDEYFNYPGWRQGEYRAFQELAAGRKLNFEFIGYCDTGEQVAVRIMKAASAAATP